MLPSKQEIENVEKQTKSSVALLDNKFTFKRFKEELTQNNFPIVHITTHGQFSSDPLKTVLVAYDKLINIRDFDSLIRGKTENSQDAIELLVLSACETAKGNKQSAMGIAGIAARQERVVLSLLCGAWMPILPLCLCKNFIEG